MEQMPEDSIKRDASFVINRENWQHKLNVELPRELEENEYCREFIYRTVKVLERRNPGLQLQLIVSTHSPFMLSDTISSQVTRIDYDEDGECVVYETSKKPFFAANLFSIMADGFFLDYTIGEYARRYLGGQYGFLRGLVDKHPDITPDEYERVNQIKLILPYIGDEMIRHSFMLILRFLGYA